MRVGQNPAKNLKEVAHPERITVAVLNYIPVLAGFYTQMLDVLKVCLNSIRETADLPYDLLVFDNGSCPEVLEYLMQEQAKGHIQYLWTTEKNLGKGGAWNIIFSGAPGEIIVYTDNDCVFSKGWLSKSVEILETYPQTGMVTARPYRTPAEFTTATLEWAKANPEVEIKEGQIIPAETLAEFDRSLGQPEEQIQRQLKEGRDVLLHYRGVSAIAGASHWQFTGRKELLSSFLPFSMDKPMGQVRQLDKRVNEAGLLRLMVSEPCAMNMSNTLPVSTVINTKPESRQRLTEKFFSLSFVKGNLIKLHDWIFKQYFLKN